MAEAVPCSRQRHADGEQHPESKESEVPAERRAEVIADVVDAKELVVDEAFDKVEDPQPASNIPK